MAGKWKKYKDARARTKELKKWAKQSAQTQGIGMKMPKGLGFKKSGGQVVKRQFAGRIATGIKKQMLDPLKAKAAKRTATATSVSKVQQDGIIRRFARDNGKAAAIKKFGADRVAKVSMSTRKIGKPPTKSKAGEGGFGISGSYQSGQPRLLPDDSWVVRGGTGGGRKSGGKVITYKMTGGQVVAHGYD